MAFIESGYVSLNKYGEQLCGDHVEIMNCGSTSITVLSDGLGSGVKASILSTLTSKILGTMIANGLRIDDAVETIAHTLPVCKERKIAYSTFSISSVTNKGEVYLIQYDNPTAILIKNGKCAEYKKKKIEVYGKVIYESRFNISVGDMLILISDGVVHAGIGQVYNLGWQRSNICDFLDEHFDSQMTSKKMAALLAGACRQLYIDMPGDDATVAVQRMRNTENINVMVGPPSNSNDDQNILGRFLSSDGKKIVCGGTTSQIVARYLHEEVEPQLEYIDKDVPPTAKIKGIDLVTEGVLTLSRAIEIIDGYTTSGDIDLDYLVGHDGASLLSRLLLEESTSIHFFVGTAINPAHQNPDFPTELSIKPRLVRHLAKSLEAAGKKVELEFY